MPRWDTQHDAAARWRRKFPQCEAIGKQIPRRCMRRAVEGGYCLQHALLRGFVGTPSIQTRGYAYRKPEWNTPSVYEVLLLPAPPAWSRTLPAKLTWDWPSIWETEVIKPALWAADPEPIYVFGDDLFFELGEPTVCDKIVIDDGDELEVFVFDFPRVLKARRFYVEVYDDRVEIAAPDGEFDDIAFAYN